VHCLNNSLCIPLSNNNNSCHYNSNSNTNNEVKVVIKQFQILDEKLVAKLNYNYLHKSTLGC